MDDLTGILIPIAICVILPIAIVLIVALTKMNSDNKRTQVILKAIEANNNIDADKLAQSLRKEKKTALEVLNGRLLRGCIFSLSGLLVILVGVFNLLSGSEYSSDPVTIPMLAGGISLAVGASFLIVYYVTRKQIEK